MSLKSFVLAVEHDIEKVFGMIQSTPAAVEIETIAVDAVASELVAVAQKFLGVGTVLDTALTALINDLAAKVVAALPTARPSTTGAPPAAPSSGAGGC